MNNTMMVNRNENMNTADIIKSLITKSSDQVKQGVIAAEQNALTGASVQAELDALQAALVG